MDKLDWKILKKLDENPKIGLKHLAKKVHSSEQVVSYRINRLGKTGILKRFGTIVHMNYIGFEHYRVLFKLKKVDKKSVDSVIEFFKGYKGVHTIVTLGGKYDLFVIIFVRNYIDYDEFIDACYNIFPNIIGEIDDVYVKNYFIYPLKYLPPDEKKPIRFIRMPIIYMALDIDKIDKKILEQIKDNCRMSSVDISKKIKVNYKTILYRIKSLEEKGIILGYKLFVDDNIHKQSLILFSLSVYSRELEKKMFDYLKAHPLIGEATKQFGNWQLMVQLYAKNEREVKAFITQFRGKFEKIRDYEVLPIISYDYVNLFPYY